MHRGVEIYESLLQSKGVLEAQLVSATDRMNKVLQEQSMLERTTEAMKSAKALLSASCIKQCEDLANSAIASVFGFPYTVQYSPDAQRFLLNKGDYSTDLADAEGGGLVTVISFVFDVFLLVKLGKHKFLAYDEAFTQVSEKYFQNFIRFVRKLCEDLQVDILLISHDNRITADDVDSVYQIESGKSIRLK